ncbi:type I-U CRISPR-associated protein Cas5/Cas6 [Azospirillum sp. RWY-5-1]|uniref:Type I-U CRISPR-associated protein Cas5/Cas6 n=1 Tax=Azospirillum oleiclasticum TaxID=2735135 RepID=A0ABX2TCF4_9PROT|nr:type I-U CRISPR-associated protein Csb2 [Azospirillum oleiclasticum]NYZ13543.1 type I-U CRISPR-associated protein Cas5/Cas6 [Azospirillum oleiclasticum]NYZ20704.1 type I-U CRISPR-associated protein Cas5/Cas6 [Azospirillum oleiclasticum]
MLAIAVEYLTGRAVATRRADRQTAEWPPHPGRLFAALVATLHEADLTEEERGAARAALAWLEALPPPAVAASDADHRTVATVWVPTNDREMPAKAPRKGDGPELLGLLPDRRLRAARAFPSVNPRERTVVFQWPDAPADAAGRHAPAIDRLAREVTCLGHSSSLVRAALCPSPPPPTLVPAEAGDVRLRVPRRGRLAELEGSFARGQRPSPGGTATYAAPRTDRGPAITPGDWIAFERVAGPVIPLRAAEGVAAAVRAALIKRAADPVPASLCGHEADNTPTRGPRIAILPLPHVGHTHATRELLGFALLLPPDLPTADRIALYRALETVDGDGVVDEFHRLALGPPGRWTIARRPDPALKTLRRDRWEGPARRWASVTPVLLDRVPKPQPGRDLAAVVAASCRFAGLPEPVAVERVSDPPVPAVPRAGAFLLDKRPERPVRVCTHLVLEFADKVAGPVLIGAGRHRGLGLFAPLPEASL